MEDVGEVGVWDYPGKKHAGKCCVSRSVRMAHEQGGFGNGNHNRSPVVDSVVTGHGVG